MQKVLILGAYGLLGYPLSSFLEGLGFSVFRHGRGSDAEISIDFTKIKLLKDFLNEECINVVINLVAATNVDLCEEDYRYAYEANVEYIYAIVEGLKAMGKDRPHLIQISTDQVYNNIGPHHENCTEAINRYAVSKLVGENIASQVHATILRTNFFGRSRGCGKLSFSDWIINALTEKNEIKVFDDIQISSLHISTLCEAIATVVDQKIPGIFNLGCLDGGSKADFSLRFGHGLGFDCKNLRVTTSDSVKLLAKRPKDMRMNSLAFQRQFSFPLPTFNSQIDLAIKEYLNEKL